MFTKTKMCGVALLALAAISTTGCVITPYTGYVAKSRQENISFHGWSLDPNASVKVYARNKYTGNYDVIATTTTGTTAYNYYGEQWYYWHVNKVIPSSYWNNANSWFKASSLLRVKINGYDATSFEEGFYYYLDEYDTLGDLVNDRAQGTTIWIAAEK
ncbi:MAG: hypothetical protein R3E01_22855 [Pirellulaceae bacterium]|nr:hypothetical protein [Planctomycetales bacterium]